MSIKVDMMIDILQQPRAVAENARNSAETVVESFKNLPWWNPYSDVSASVRTLTHRVSYSSNMARFC